MSEDRVNEIMDKYSDNPNLIVNEYPAICNMLREKYNTRVLDIMSQKHLSEDD